ncbi:hypothetical protein TSAR_016000 [Trichomalopsis sarcophagae]|uniref:Uncharacterized protein n=1 Tax=Trichomalopsis sarcophagae TaxID=543379 RepID=A0A232EMW5_9HYME|nr:hypothetical protein TSAR_016000 [Trichomalopsis sarcophagae]
MTRVLKLVFLTLVLQGTPNHAEVIKEGAPPFICIDGSEISLTNVCDGLPHCADSSDETTKLCHHVVCPVATFRCAYGACIARSGRCNGFVDCVDGSDELYCDDDSDCRDHKFRCPTSSECISSAHVCDGIRDCADGGDENAEICRDYVCPGHAFQCSYGGCVHQEVVCDGIKDCVDATDETEDMCAAANCKGEDCERYACGYDEFSCENVRQCIPLSRVCDGTHQCRDASDEKSETCKSRR